MIEKTPNDDILDILSLLRKRFFNDEEALRAVAVLEKKAGNKGPKIENKNSQEGSFPLPDEILEDEQSFALFSDGACRGNPGPGAWGSLGQDPSGLVLFEASGVDLQTTNNRMELEGAIQGLVALKKYCFESSLDLKVTSIYLYSDSKYVVDGMTRWVYSWKGRGWKKADKKEPENLEQWKTLDELVQEFYKVHFRWVKGHAGHPQNEKCDELANQALDESGF